MYSSALLISVWQRLDQWDKWLFIKLNSQWTNPVFDAALPYVRNPLIWVPLYIFILAFITLNYGKKGLWWTAFLLCTVSITDMVGARLFKEFVHRLRPCQDPDFSFHVRLLLKQCSGSFSFVSNHAANHFGMAAFIAVTFKGIFKKWMNLAYVWAFLISYSQIYVGVHYPLDVLGGTILGVSAGTLTAWLFHKYLGNLNLDNQL